MKRINMTCIECGGALRWEKHSFSIRGVNLGRFDFLVCSACGDRLHSMETSREIEAAAKKAGVWGPRKTMGKARRGTRARSVKLVSAHPA